MILDDLKDQLTERLQTAWSEFQESSTYVSAKEKYEDLSPNAQKAVKAAALVFAILMVFYMPYSYLSSSNDSMASFDQSKSLIRELFRVSRAAKELANAPTAMSAMQLQGRVQGELQSFRLQPEQIKGVNNFNNAGPHSSSSIPKNVIQEGVEVSLAKLNLRQVVDIGTRMQNLDQSVKMVGMQVLATPEDPHYFDVTFKLVTFSLPVEPEKPMPTGKKRKSVKADDDAME